MAIVITGANHANPVAASAGAKSTQWRSSTSAPADSVQISNAAKTALQEATETHFQTSQVASKGDQQAQKLLAEQTARQNR
jgi:hypothetical protein